MNPAAKKRFGQHFLRDRGVIDRIVRLVRPAPHDTIVEVGAGEGALSIGLAASVSKLLAIELDSECLPVLRASLSRFAAAQVVCGDILRLELEELVRPHLVPGSRLRIVGNLPYNIGTRIIELLLESQLPIADMTFMVQLEVAERIIASQGNRRFGLLSILCQHRADVRMAFKVPPACFFPRPKVISALVVLQPTKARSSPEFEAVFAEIAKAAFTHRRKTLANSLRLDPGMGAYSGALLAEAGIDGARRPEDLSVAEYERLAQARLESLTRQGLRP